MTTVHIALSETNPTAEYVALQRYSGAMLFGTRLRVYLDGAAEATVDLESTVGKAWRWRAQEIGYHDVVTRTVAVPESETPVEYADLVDVDPETMQPDDEPEAAWWQALSETAAGVVPDGSVTLVKLAPDVLAELDEVGQPGPQGEQGLSAYEVAVAGGYSGTEADWLLGLVGPAGLPGATGPKGDPGPGVTAGGTAGQVLAKGSATDYDTEWIDPVPSAHASSHAPGGADDLSATYSAVDTVHDSAPPGDYLRRIRLDYPVSVGNPDVERIYVGTGAGELSAWRNEWGALRGTPTSAYKADALVRGIPRTDLGASADGGWLELENASRTTQLYKRDWWGRLWRSDGAAAAIQMADVLVLGPGDPVPSGTPEGTVIVRTEA